MYKAVVFDLDETLVSLNVPIRVCLSDALKSVQRYFKVQLDLDTLVEVNNKAIEPLLKKYNNGKILLSQLSILIWYETLSLLNMEPSPRVVFGFHSSFFDSLLHHTELKNGVRELLYYLRDKECKIGVLSNGNFTERMRNIEKVGIIDSIDALVTSDEVGVDKPSEKPFKEISLRLGVPLKEILYVGDSYEHDIVGAKKLGVDYLLCIKKDQEKTIQNNLKTISDLQEIKRYIK